MATPKKLPSGRWRIQVYLGKDADGVKRKKSITADTKREAELLAAQMLAEEKSETASDLTVGQAIDKYIESKSNILSPTTIRSYKTMRNNNLQSIMRIHLSELSRNDVQSAVNKEAQRLSPKSVHNAYGLLSSSLAVYAPDLNISVSLPKKQKRLREMPRTEDIIRIIRGTDIELPCLLAIWLGMRVSEIRGLTKSDIQNGNIFVRRAVVTVDRKQIIKESTKTYDSTRVADIPEYIQSLIDNVETEFLTELTRDQIYQKFKKLQRLNGINPEITFHDLRHLNASVMVQLHIPDKYAMERGGWATNSTLRNVYQHTFSDERNAVNAKINEYFEDIIEKSSHESDHNEN